MAKDYKAMKEAWVTGLTGSSVADVNSVSLAMPVIYTCSCECMLPMLTMLSIAHPPTLVRPAIAHAFVHPLYARLVSRRFLAQLRSYPRCDHRVLILAVAAQSATSTASSLRFVYYDFIVYQEQRAAPFEQSYHHCNTYSKPSSSKAIRYTLSRIYDDDNLRGHPRCRLPDIPKTLWQGRELGNILDGHGRWVVRFHLRTRLC
jgi:hypothetical protein